MFDADERVWLSSVAALILLINLYCTALIVWRIHYIKPATCVRFQNPSKLKRISTVFAGTMGLCTFWNILFLVTYEVGSSVASIALTTWPHISGIALMLVNIRISLNRLPDAGEPDETFSFAIDLNEQTESSPA